MTKVLLIEDDAILGKAIKQFLEKHGFEVSRIDDANEFIFTGYDIFIVDWILKTSSGLDVVKSLKKNNINAPVVMITVKSSLDDKLLVFEEGVDDYITKPFEPEELLARIKAVIRRYYNKNWIKVNEDISIDLESRKVLKNNKEIKLTKKEFMILEVLLKRKGSVVSYDFLLDYVWNENGSYETLKSHIYSLKNKLSKDLIYAVKGLGYKID